MKLLLSFIFIYSLSVHSDPARYRPNTEDMREFFARSHIIYQQGFTYCDALKGAFIERTVGSRTIEIDPLAVSIPFKPHVYLNELLLAPVSSPEGVRMLQQDLRRGYSDPSKVYSVQDLFKVPSVWLEHVPQVGGYGVFADANFVGNDIIGVHAGKIIYSPPSSDGMDSIDVFGAPNKDEEYHAAVARGSDEFFRYSVGSLPDDFSDRHTAAYANVVPWVTMANLSRPNVLLQTSRLLVDAHHVANEMRFVKHSTRHANAEMAMVFVRITQEDLAEENPIFGDFSRPGIFAVTVIKARQPIARGQQILCDYGYSDATWERMLGHSRGPVDLEP